MDSATMKQAFLKLKPLCDELMKIPCEKTAQDVVACIKGFPDSVVCNLVEYICYPITVHLQRNTIK